MNTTSTPLTSTSLHLFIVLSHQTARTGTYTFSLHDALPILEAYDRSERVLTESFWSQDRDPRRSEEHTSELQSHSELVCRLLLEKKKPRRLTVRNLASASPQRPMPESRNSNPQLSAIKSRPD